MSRSFQSVHRCDIVMTDRTSARRRRPARWTCSPGATARAPGTRTMKDCSPMRVSISVSAPRYSTATTRGRQAVAASRSASGRMPIASVRSRRAGAPAASAPSPGQERRRKHVHRRRADEARREDRRGLLVERGGRGVLLDAAAAHQDHLVRHGHRLDLIVGDIQHGHAEAALQGADFAPHLDAQLRVEVGERLVHQADRRLARRSRGRARRAAAARRRAARACGRAGARARGCRRRA